MAVNPKPERAGSSLPVLRVPVSTFVGRESDLKAVVATLQSGGRLVSLTGPGGVGKTRLSLRVAQELSEHYVEGVMVVNLTAVTDERLVPLAVGRALGVRENRTIADTESGESNLWPQVLERLQDRHALLLIDNFEHVIGAAPYLSDLLQHCPAISLLVTSRARLNLTGEQQISIAPLPWPDPKASSTKSEVEAYDAVGLFVERARLVLPGFQITDENASTIASICARLDGLPLALELAAARLRLLPLAALHNRLERRLPLLSGGSRDQPARQRSMTDAIAWSYDLLSLEQQLTFLQLAVFSGGFSLEAAEAVLGSDGSSSAFDAITSFVKDSLISVLPNGRFVLLGTIREFANDRLVLNGGFEAASDRHTEYFEEFARIAAPALFTNEATQSLRRLEEEHDNLRAALRRLINTREAGRAQRMAGSLHWFWFLHSHFREGQSWLEETLRLCDGDDSNDDISALLGLGILAYDQAAYATATLRLQQCVDRAAAVGDTERETVALQFLGLSAFRQGQPKRRREYLSRSLDLATTSGYAWGRATALCAIAHGADQNDAGGALASLREAIEIFRHMGDSWGLARAANSLGEHSRLSGNIEQAHNFYNESLRGYEALGNENSIALVSHNLGCVHIIQGDYRRALERFSIALRLHHKHGDRRGVGYGVAGVAGAFGYLGKPDFACRLLGAAEMMFEATGAARDPVDEVVYKSFVSNVEVRLPGDQFESLWQTGRLLPPDEAITDAINAASMTLNEPRVDSKEPVSEHVPAVERRKSALPPVGMPTAEAAGPKAHNATLAPLSPTELRVARLIAEGLTNREIGERLFLSHRTIDTHVSHVLQKLRVGSRVGVAVLIGVNG
jgi:predicted ATPase/DNA-binding CsgD family transcriptional regulator